MTLDDLYQSVKATLYDRVSSPLWGAFVISWAVWNYQMVIVVLSGMTPDAKFNYIGKALYFDWTIYAIRWGVAPLITAVIFIGFVPFLGEKAYRVSRFWKVRLKNAKLEYDGKTPMSQDEVNQILWRVAEEKRELEGKVIDAIKEKSDVEMRLQDNLEQLSETQSSASVVESKLIDAEKKITELELALDLKKMSHKSDRDLLQHLLNNEFTLIFNAEAGKSKTITFNENKTVGKGRNKNEDHWELDSNQLIIFTDSDKVQNVFDFDPDTEGFAAAKDVQVNALPNQSILLIRLT